MFLPVDSSASHTDLPRHCTFSESDWRILAGFWHPIAFCHEIADRPVPARLLDVDLVVWRTAGGISVARDLCPHRGTRLSAGRIDADQLICPMHGLHFDPQGACSKIPSNPDQQARVSPRLRLQSLRVCEKYGIVWTCLADNPAWPLPDWPGLRDPALKRVFVPPNTWAAAASRHVENFNDVAHFPWVHKETFGGSEEDRFPSYDVEETPYGLMFQLGYDEGGNRFPDDVPGDSRHVVYTYQLTWPFSTIIIIQPNDSTYVQYFADTVCPVSAHETRIFQVATDTTGAPDEDFLIAESLMINDEDKALVEAQRPEDLPLNVRDEVHIPADAMSVAYRRGLVRHFGLGRNVVS
ncbi:aromatic ring-hydroxylating dioxygenase subunit alpha [uncultured Roseobacter sp.]|uniref:aromatic ring-hydroxylating oxygenase subunit alpha n=1 Tax=uncultured Roseobacter sp. TaxID=114847 RepID=UPI0026229ADD|nr:aromatic ring-hydroxylating dioxygenase subunit alpha [uncultured Roseobacter sp.]